MDVLKIADDCPIARAGVEAEPAMRSNRSGILLAIGVATLLGATLRVLAAQGDLWFDEFWTLELVSSARSAADIVFHTRYDNNHFTNSLWMWASGADASNLRLRAFSVLLGILTVPAAAMACRRHSDTAAVIAAFIFAIGCFYVNYGSEARGYSAMIFSIVVAKAALDRLVEDRPSPGAWAAFVLSIAFGLFSHVTMIEAAGALGLAALAQMVLREQPRRGVAIALAAGLASLPGLACFLKGFLSPDFHLGVPTKFTYDVYFQGLAGAFRPTLALPEPFRDRAVVAITAVAAIVAVWLLPAQRRFFPVIAVFVLPALHAVGELPNQIYPRFHLTAIVALALLVSEGGAALWLRGGVARKAAVLAAAVLLVTQTLMLADLLRFGRGGYTAAVKHMTAGGPATYTSDHYMGETALIVRHILPRAGGALKRVDPAHSCVEPAGWLIDVTMSFDPEKLPGRRALVPQDGGCRIEYVLDSVFQAKSLSGMNWWVYRRAS